MAVPTATMLKELCILCPDIGPSISSIIKIAWTRVLPSDNQMFLKVNKINENWRHKISLCGEF